MSDKIKTWVRRLVAGDEIRCIKELFDCKPGDIGHVVKHYKLDGKDTIMFTLVNCQEWSAHLENLDTFFEPLFHTNGLYELKADEYWLDAVKPGDKLRLIEPDEDRVYGEAGDEVEFIGLSKDFQASYDMHRSKQDFPSVCIKDRRNKVAVLRPCAWRFEPISEPRIQVEPVPTPTMRSLIEKRLLAGLTQLVAE